MMASDYQGAKMLTQEEKKVAMKADFFHSEYWGYQDDHGRQHL